MPDRLPSLIVLVAVWVPPAIAGWVAAGSVLRTTSPDRVKKATAVLTTFVLSYTAAWFLFNFFAMPPYIPGAVPADPTFATPKAVAWLSVFTAAVILPVSAVACFLAFRRRLRVERTSAA